MTDGTDGTDHQSDEADPRADVDPALHEGEAEEVRRLLGGLGQEPLAMPPAVASRLDDVLGDLIADRLPGNATGDRPAAGDGPGSGSAAGSGAGAGATVTTLSATARHEARRRRWPQALVAAASVAVLGIGAAQVLSSGGTDSLSSSPAMDESADQGKARSAGKPGEKGGPSAQSGAGAAASGKGPQTDRDGDRLRWAETLDNVRLQDAARLRSARFTHDVRQVASLLAAVPPERGADNAAGPPQRRCEVPRARGTGVLLAVRLDGQPATLLLRPPRDGARIAEVYRCRNAAAPVRVAEVPQP